MKHAKQHFVPSSYLAGWCAADTPEGHEPSVWVFPKTGGAPYRRAPKNLFHENEFYTIKLRDGERDLRIEQGLSVLEGRYASMRDKQLHNREVLTDDDHVYLCAFVAAMHGRTRRQRDHFRDQWQGVLDHMKKLEAHVLSLPPEQQQQIARSSLPPSRGRSMGMKDVERIVEEPVQHAIVPIVETQTPMLAEMDMAVLLAPPDRPFITSDAPCVWFDPEARTRPFPYNAVGLAWPKVEVTLPLSPTQMLVLNHQGLAGYMDAKREVIDELNRRTRGHADQEFIANVQVADPHWYEMVPRGARPDADNAT